MLSDKEIVHKKWEETKVAPNQPTAWPQCRGSLEVSHSTKFIRTFGSYLENKQIAAQVYNPKNGPLGGWLEWEAPTSYRLACPMVTKGPEAIYYPEKISSSFLGQYPHSTDPYILSEDREVGHFFYSSCGQGNPPPNFTAGNLIVCVHHSKNIEFFSSVLVVGDVMVYHPSTYPNDLNAFPHPSIPEHFIRTTLEPLRIYWQRVDHSRTFSLCRGVHFTERKNNGQFSFFPASTDVNGSPPCNIDSKILKSSTDPWKYLFDETIRQGFDIGIDLRF